MASLSSWGLRRGNHPAPASLSISVWTWRHAVTPIEVRFRVDRIRPREWSLPVAMALSMLLATGCDIAPPPLPTQEPVPTEPLQIGQTAPSPWDIGWIPADSEAVASRIDSILVGTGLSGHGAAILQLAQEYGVNPAFALAMFRKEAEFAKQGSIAYSQNNPGNIICGGGTTPLYGATGCGVRFGTYDTMADGIRAYFWLLNSEYKPGRKYDCEDIPCIITVYCPPSDCDTARYVEQVVDWTILYKNLLSAGGALVLQPGPTVPSMAVTVLPATVIPRFPAVAASPTDVTLMPSLTEGRIAFSSIRDGDWEIYVMNVDGSGLTRLTNNADTDCCPSWSPDAARIAFESARDGNWEIYVMSADGSAVTRLTDNSAWDSCASWSPDGTRISFVSERDGNQEIYVMDVDGTNQRNLTNNLANDFAPSWSPDGTRIAFGSEREGVEVYIMNADGGGLTSLTNKLGYDAVPSWSPDGTRMAFGSELDGNYEIFVMNVDGSGLTRLTNNPYTDCCPSWSPDGRRIAFDSYRGGQEDIYTINADGTGLMNLTNNPSWDADPSWSPR